MSRISIPPAASKLTLKRSPVVGVETNPTILETARARVRATGWTNVTFLEGDVQSASLDEDFDAVVGRWIMMYLPEPVAVLHLLLSRFQPGGLVAFQENDFTYPPMSFPPAPLHKQLLQCTTPPLDSGGSVRRISSKVYRTYLDA